MPRKNLIRTSQYFYHVTTRANHKFWFSIPLEDVWRISAYSFNKAQKNHPAEVSQFVLMGNHYHLLIRTPQSDIDQFMYFFNKEFSSKLRLKSGLENRMFGSNYKWSLITKRKHFFNVFRYIYQNPLRANLIDKCENYKFSSLYYTSRGFAPPFPFKEISKLERDLEYINSYSGKDLDNKIAKGLKKCTYTETSGRPR